MEHPAGSAPVAGRAWLPHVVLLAACVLAYSNTFANKFVLDDNSIIVENSRIRALDRWADLFTTPYWGTQSEDLLYRPLTVLTYAIDRHFSLPARAGDELDPTLFHVNNLLLHALATWLLWRFLRALLAGHPAAESGAFCAALVFAVHPIHTEAVTGIVGRAEVLCAVFYFLAARLWLRFRDAENWSNAAAWYLLALACFGLALLSKEMGLTLPGIFALCDAWRVASAPGGARWRSLLTTRVLGPQVGCVLVILIYFIVRSTVLGQVGPTATVFSLYQTPWHVRMLTAITVLADYVRMLFVPIGLRAEYAENVNPAAFAAGWLDPWALLSLGGFGVLGWGAWKTRERAPLVAFCLLWFLLTVIPISNLILPIGCVKAERFLYIPSVAGALALAALIGALRSAPGRRWGAPATQAALAALALVFLVGTCLRNRAWADEKSLYADAIAKDPGRNARAYCWLGSYHFVWGKHDEAMAQFGRAIAIIERYPQFYEFRGRLYQMRKQNDLAKADYDRAIEYSGQLNPRGVPHPRLLQARGNLLREQGDIDGARRDLDLAVKLNPGDANIVNDCGVLYLFGLHEYAVAAEYFRAALRIDGANALAVYNRGLTWYYRKDLKAALADFDLSLRMNPSLEVAYEARGVALMELGGDRKQAVQDLLKAVELNPAAARAANYLVLVLLDLGLKAEALKAYQHLIQNQLPVMTEVKDRLR